MATGTLAPAPYVTVLDLNGAPVSGAKIWTYLAGTTTAVATYTEVSLTTQNTNPIIADAAGRWVAFLSPGASYKFVVQYADGSALRTQDNVLAVPASGTNTDITGVAGETLTAGFWTYLSDGSGSKTAGSWYKGDPANPYSSTLPEVGMVPATIIGGASGTIRLSGSVPGLSSLTVGTTYYGSTAGAITSTEPTNGRLLGVADTTASLILSPNPSALFGAGVVTAPAMSFLVDPDTGFYREAANTLAATTNGVKALGIDSTQFIDSPTQPRCRAYKNGSAQVIPDTTATAISFDAETHDVGGMHDTVTANTKITIPTGGDGLYLIVGSVSWAANATGVRALTIKKNGTTALIDVQASVVAAATHIMATPPDAHVLAAGDYVELYATQTSGGNLNVNTGTTTTFVSAVKLW